MTTKNRIFSLPHNEWGYLLGLLQSLAVDLKQAAAYDRDSLQSQEIDELNDLLIMAQAYIDYIEGGDKRIYVRNWHDDVRRRLQEIKTKQ